MTEQVRSIRRDIDDDLLISNRNGFKKRSTRRSVGLQLEDAGMVHAEPQLFGGAEHAVRLHAADLAALELETTGQRRADGGEGVGLPRLHILRTAHDLQRGRATGIHHAQRESISVGMLAHLEDARHHHVAQVLMDRHDAVHRSDLPSQPVGDVLAFEGLPQQGLEPTTRDDHLMNCSRKRTSLSKNSRISGMPWRSIAMRSGPMPHAKPVYFSLSTLQFSSTAGWTMPEPRISIQPVCLQAAQPEPPQIWHCTSISADGSVNGKYDGRNRTLVVGEKMRRTNVASVALKSTNVMPSSTTRPSICSNTGEWEASNGSRR